MVNLPQMAARVAFPGMTGFPTYNGSGKIRDILSLSQWNRSVRVFSMSVLSFYLISERSHAGCIACYSADSV